MLKNYIYSFIKLCFDSAAHNTLLNKEQLTFKTNINGEPCAFYQLKPVNVALPEGYRLTEHHLSFYEKQDDSNPYLSQYHYTAYLQKQNASYQLHVFFNNNDQLATSPELVLTSTNEKQNISSDLSYACTQLAIEQSLAVITRIRQQHKEFTTQHASQYEDLEKELSILSNDLNGNLSSYQIKLDEIIKIIAMLADLNSDKKHQNLLNLFRRLKIKVAPSVSINYKTTALEEKAEIITDKSSAYETGTIIPSVLHTKQPVIDFINKAQQAKTDFQSAANDADKLKQFNTFHQTTYDALIWADDSCTHQDLIAIHNLAKDVEAAANKLLMNFVLKNQLELAAGLKSYLNPIPDNLIKLALVKGNDKLLEFLLQNGSFPINTFIVNSNLNPILYCIENDKPESPKAGCLSVLIKHGASLQVKDSQGLPAAQRIIESPSLSPTLNEHAELTIINPRFYTTLIQDLQNYLTQENITELTKARIEKFIDIYSKTNNHLSTVVDKSQHASLVKEVSSLLRTKITALFKYFSQFNDTDIINAYAAYQEIATLYSDQLSAQEKRRAGLELKEFLKNANSENNFENSLSKEDILKLITSMTEKVKVKVQLLNASQQAQAKPNKRNANQVNKLNHELVAIDSKLEAEIKSKQQDPNSTEILKKLSLGLKAMQKGTKMIANMMQDIADSYKDVNANIESFNRTTKNMNFKDAKAHQIAKANKLQVAIKNHMEKEQALEEVTAYFRNALGDKINIQAQNEQPVSTEGKASEHGMFGNSNRLSLTDESSQNNLNLENTNLYNSRSG